AIRRSLYRQYPPLMVYKIICTLPPIGDFAIAGDSLPRLALRQLALDLNYATLHVRLIILPWHALKVFNL
ncbi:hypothetical protein ABTM82_19860, partial [Acinetobacter baumannii]